MSENGGVVQWLLDADPAIRWQAMRDLTDAPREGWSAVRGTVATQGWGVELLSHAGDDGLWAGGTFVPAGFSGALWKAEGQPWTATTYAFTTLRECGIEPQTPQVQRAVQLAGKNGRWDEGDQPFWEGEVEECINGRTLADGAYFGVDMAPLVARLVTAVQDDGGWNCERASGSKRSSYHSTINVLEGLLAFEKATGGTTESRAARKSGEEFLLERNLFRRLSTGESAAEHLSYLIHPSRWYYSELRALDYFRDAAMTVERVETSELANPKSP
ncbi:MAG: squalene cyclase, partial [Acidobacteria bacterium]|nr:squalene cyclase [Acidobacteriota bacterium]